VDINVGFSSHIEWFVSVYGLENLCQNLWRVFLSKRIESQTFEIRFKALTEEFEVARGQVIGLSETGGWGVRIYI
jgi:hypothetical protein